MLHDCGCACLRHVEGHEFQQIESCSNSNRGFFCLGASIPVQSQSVKLWLLFWILMNSGVVFVSHVFCFTSARLQEYAEAYIFDIISWCLNTRISVHSCASFMKTDHECLIIVGSGQGGYTSSKGGQGRGMVTGPPFNKCLACSFKAMCSKLWLRLSRVFSRGLSVLVWRGRCRRKRYRRGAPVVDVTIG